MQMTKPDRKRVVMSQWLSSIEQRVMENPDVRHLLLNGYKVKWAERSDVDHTFTVYLEREAQPIPTDLAEEVAIATQRKGFE